MFKVSVMHPCLSMQASLLLLLKPLLGQVPPYVRGKGNYRFMLTPTDRANGMGHLGAHTRLRLAMDRLRRGQELSKRQST